jgi:uncharacterized protein
MLELRPNCECCDRDLPSDAEAYICTYECTWCAACAEHLGTCPNCGGNLVIRPVRPSAKLLRDPASTVRVHAATPCPLGSTIG